MTDILPPAGWPNVRQLETNEFATGGANGNMNEQAKSLAARSELLKQYAALPYESKTGGYALNERVQLANGDIVRSTIPSNVNNPNVDMTGWVKTNNASQITDASGKNQQQINDNQKFKNQDLVSVKDFGAKGDRVTNDSPAVQNYYNQHVEAEHATYMYFPTWKEEYLFESPIKMKNGGLRIFGFKGVSYNKYYYGSNKTLNRYGNIIVGGTHALDLGDYRVSGEDNTLPLDSWTIEGLGFRQKDGSATRSKDAIHITTLQDSPDRPMMFRDLTITQMNRGIYIPFVDTNVIVMAANLSVKDSNISGNNYGFLAEGRVYGASFRDAVIEHNILGGIHGYFDSYLTIENCLLEGQVNAVNLAQKIPFDRVIPHPQLTIKNNYMEANSGDYCINYNYPEAIDARLEVIGNNGSVQDSKVTDFLRIEGARYLDLQYDCRKYSATLMHNPVLSPDSVLTTHLIPYFNVRKVGRQNGLSPSMGAIIFDKNYINKQSGLEHTELNSSVATDLKYTSTTHGSLSYVDQEKYLSASIPQINVGDLFAINALIKIDATNYTEAEVANLNMTVLNQDGNGFAGWQVDYAANKLVGGMMMVTLVGHAVFAATQARFRLTGNSGKIIGKLFRANIRNYGSFVNDGTQRVAIYPHCPKLDNSKLFSITGNDVTSLAAGAEVVQYFNATPAKLGDLLVAKYIGSASAGQYFSIKAECTDSLGRIAVTFKNTSNSVLSLTAPLIQIKAIHI